jgi:hypothetical protein
VGLAKGGDPKQMSKRVAHGDSVVCGGALKSLAAGRSARESSLYPSTELGRALGGAAAAWPVESPVCQSAQFRSSQDAQTPCPLRL